MSLEEMEAWHAALRDHQQHQKLVSALRDGPTKSTKPKVDISEYV